MRHRPPIWLIVAQAALFLVVAWFIWHALEGSWTELRASDVVFDLHAGMIAGAILVVLATYGLLIEAWRRLILGTGTALSYRDAASAWTLSNLGRYLPGKVWAVAGLAVLAQRRGVSRMAATGSAVMLQILSIGTGAAIAFVLAPGSVAAAWLVIGVVIAAMSVISLTWPPAFRWLARLAPGVDRDAAAPLSFRIVFVGVLATGAAWLTYGLALWLLAKGTLPAEAVPLAVAPGIFAASYVAGLLALFAPGGVGVREGVLFALLASHMSAPAALALALASRILLTLAELLAALAGWAMTLQTGRNSPPA